MRLGLIRQKPTRKRRIFISLKWKALLLLSLVLIAINGSFHTLNAINLDREFENDRNAIHQRNIAAVTGLLQESSQRLQQTAYIIPSLAGMRGPLARQNTDSISRTFDQHWPLLFLETGVDMVAFYGQTNNLLALWGANDAIGDNDNALHRSIVRANKAEIPETIVDCTRTCLQYTVVPVLAEGKRAGVIVLGKSLAGIIVSFSLLSSTDMGLLISDHRQSEDERWLEAWGSRITALTNAAFMLDVLRDLASDYRFEQVLNSRTTINVSTHHYDVRVIGLDNLARAAGGYLVTIEDITNATRDITNAKRDTMLTGVMGLIISECLLLFILWTPLSRLRRTAAALPLLAKSDYKTARQTFAATNERRSHQDEIDQLDRSALTLSNQLEVLEQEVTARASDLADKMKELTRERDFIRELLDTAQVIIITQDGDGNILLINNYGEVTTGYLLSELRNKKFIDVISPADRDISSLQSKLHKVALGEQNAFQHEASVACKRGNSITVAWLHSHLLATDQSEPVILSVGLDITARKQAEERIAWLADHDPLTGLFNRRRFQGEVEKSIRLAQRYDYSGALLFLDLDNFKYINDTYGHHAGDILIKRISAELTDIVRDSDVVARFGGDEFAILMPEVKTDNATDVAQKINDQLNQLTFPIRGHHHKVSISVGIALFPYHGLTVDEVLANADLAMYQVKQKRRGSWHVFSVEEQARERMETEERWRQQIKQALTQERFVLYFQPIISLTHNAISHYEVLLRMLDDSDQPLLPSEFIEVAERCGLIHDIDHMVLHKATAAMETAHHNGHDVKFTINLSAHSLSDPDLLPLLEKLLTTTPVPTKNFIFEITETAALADFSAACTLIDTIKKMGCHFALDDFGVGFSSFFYLRELPVDYVKIDGSFIRHLARNRDDQMLVKSMNDVARWFGKQTIAEAVEDAETLTLLKSYNVNYAQGFYIGKPAARVA